MAFQFKIQLTNIAKPPVWRRVLVPEKMTFDDLHRIIQAVFPWEDYHLYLFNPKGYGSHPSISVPSDDDLDELDMDAEETLLSQVLATENQKFTYVYDFGDDWVHSIVLEKILPEKVLFPICQAGKGACPPEDCGGPWGYENLKRILSDPGHEEYADTRAWVGLEDHEKWDAARFDLEAANKALQETFRNR